MRRAVLLGAAGALLMAGAAYAVSQITRSVPAGGGTGGQSASYRVRSTLGQSCAANATGTVHTLRAGFWPGAVPSASDVAGPGSIPASFALHANSPNPFQANTAIHYDVPPGGGPVSLYIFDVQGRRVRTLLDGAQPAGRRQVAWDGRDDHENSVPPGVYFCVLNAPGFEATRKLIRSR